MVNWVSRGVFLGWLGGWLVGRFAGGLKKILEKYLDKMNAETEFSVQKNPGTPPEKNLRKLFDKKKIWSERFCKFLPIPIIFITGAIGHQR